MMEHKSISYRKIAENCEPLNYIKAKNMSHLAEIYRLFPILGDPGATSRDDVIFSGESLL